MKKVFSENFWSESSAKQAAKRFEKQGWIAKVVYSMDASMNWCWRVNCY